MYDSPAFSNRTFSGSLSSPVMREPRARELGDQGQTDVADADHDDVSGLGFNFLEQGSHLKPRSYGVFSHWSRTRNLVARAWRSFKRSAVGRLFTPTCASMTVGSGSPIVGRAIRAFPLGCSRQVCPHYANIEQSLLGEA